MWKKLINNDFPCASVDCLADIIHPPPHDLKKTPLSQVFFNNVTSHSLHHTNMTSEPWMCWEDTGVSVCHCKETGWRTMVGWKMVTCLGVRVSCMLITNDKVEKWVQDIIYTEHINQDLTWGISLSSTQQQLNKYRKHSQYVVKLTVNMWSEKSGTEFHQVTSIFACLQLFLRKTVNITGTTFIMRVNNQILKPWHLNYK